MEQLTSHPSINHPSYFLQSSFLPGDEKLFFTSYRTGGAQLFEIGIRSRAVRQLTHREAVHPFSAAFDERRNEIVFARGGMLHAVSPETLEERRIGGVEGAQFGEPSLSPDGEYATAAFKDSGGHALAVVRMDGGGVNVIRFPRTIIHPQFHPLEPEWIEFAADPSPRMHRVRRDGSGLECLYEHGNDEFVVHETFLGRTGDIVFTVWPFSLCAMDWTTRHIRKIADHNCWHISPNRAGTEVLFDTNHPDRGIQIIDVSTGVIRDVCRPDASNGGSQWKRSSYAMPEDFAAARSAAGQHLSWMEAGTDTVYGPQYTHPHPSWSRGEGMIAFASDRSGYPQVYVAEVPRR